MEFLNLARIIIIILIVSSYYFSLRAIAKNLGKYPSISHLQVDSSTKSSIRKGFLSTGILQILLSFCIYFLYPNLGILFGVFLFLLGAIGLVVLALNPLRLDGNNKIHFSGATSYFLGTSIGALVISIALSKIYLILVTTLIIVFLFFSYSLERKLLKKISYYYTEFFHVVSSYVWLIVLITSL